MSLVRCNNVISTAFLSADSAGWGLSNTWAKAGMITCFGLQLSQILFRVCKMLHDISIKIVLSPALLLCASGTTPLPGKLAARLVTKDPCILFLSILVVTSKGSSRSTFRIVGRTPLRTMLKSGQEGFKPYTFQQVHTLPRRFIKEIID